MKIRIPRPSTEGYLLLTATTILVTMGLVMVYSVTGVHTMTRAYGAFLGALKNGSVTADRVPMPDTMAYFVRQLKFLGIGLAGAFLVYAVDWTLYRKYVRIAALLVLGLLVSVFFVGHSIKGASRWIPLGVFNLQPTEFAKPFLVFATAHYFARVEQGDLDKSTAYMLLIGFSILTIFLVLLQPDLGNTILMGVILLALWVIHGIDLKYLAGVGFFGSAVVIWAFFGTWRFHRRVLPYLFPDRFLRPGDQPLRSLEALGSGGLTGMGLGNGPYKMKYLAEAHTDYIGAMIGQELGFVGIMVVVLAFALMFWAAMRIAMKWRERDRFRYYVALGLGLLLTFHGLMNLSVITYLFPSKGITLPFISYGGSSLVASLATVALLLSVDSHTLNGTLDSATVPETHESEPEVVQ